MQQDSYIQKQYQQYLNQQAIGSSHSALVTKKLTWLLICFIALRLFLLEYTPLIDPTETRYAFIAQHMTQTGDWLTPHLPYPEGNVPYLGKPPLHFWLTAICYKIFGIDELGSRLPSFIAMLGIFYIQFWIAKSFFTKEIGLLSCIISLATGLFFFGGASVVDVTLAFFICASITCYIWYEITPQKKLAAIWMAIFAGLGFLIKGPIAPVLIGLPLCIWLYSTKRLPTLKSFPWITSIVVFLLVVSPWFYFSEMQNPGFLKYFFWNENIARYITTNYGDKYGSGHVFPRGAAWVMLLILFSPWSLILFARYAKRDGVAQIKEYLAITRLSIEGFILIAALAPAIFFTLVKQLHTAYMIPSIPFLGLITAKALLNHTKDTRPTWPLYRKIMEVIVVFGILLSGGFLINGLIYHPTTKNILFLYSICAIVIVLTVLLTSKMPPRLKLATRTSGAVISACFCAIISLTPYLNLNKSTDLILHKIAYEAKELWPVVGVVDTNIFSLFWITRSWEGELGQPVEIKFVDFAQSTPLPKHLLIKEDQLSKLPDNIKDTFQVKYTIGKWSWLTRN